MLTSCHPCRGLPREVLAVIEYAASDTPTRAAHNAQMPSTVAFEGMSLSTIVFPSACTYTLVKSPSGMDRQRRESSPSLTLQAVQLCRCRTSKVVEDCTMGSPLCPAPAPFFVSNSAGAVDGYDPHRCRITFVRQLLDEHRVASGDAAGS